MRYKRVCIDGFGYTLPREVVSTAIIEERLAPLYRRLRLPEGRLELMSGIRARRFWPENTSITELSLQSAERAIEAARVDRDSIGALVHGSVCRDYLEPATACGVHAGLSLPTDCAIYDVSNACLGILNGVVQIANMIELGQIQAGLAVGSENGRQLVENTIRQLNADSSLTRSTIKHSIASLTIGSASVAVLLCNAEISRAQNHLTAATWRTETKHAALCQSDGLETIMQTDSERLMREGIAAGVATFGPFLDEAGWDKGDIDKTVCHQVGVAHRKLLFESLQLPTDIDFTTLEFLGNTGAAALPVTMALGIERGHIREGDRVAMLGIGSGINCLMLAAQWQDAAVVAGGEG